MDALVGLAALSRDVDVQQLGPGRQGRRLTSEWRLVMSAVVEELRLQLAEFQL